MANPDGDRPPGTEHGDGDDDCEGSAAAAQRRSGLARLDRRQPADAADEGAGNDETLERDRMGGAAKGMDLHYVQPSEREALRPLHSLWIDLLVLRLLNEPKDEPDIRYGSCWTSWRACNVCRSSIPRSPRTGKSKNPLVLGFQGKAQLEVIYGHLAEVMLSQPATKIFLKTTEPKAAEWVSNAIGKVEIERLRETHFDGSRSGRNFTVDRQVEPLVMDSEISGLAEPPRLSEAGQQRRPLSLRVHGYPADDTGISAAQAGGRRTDLRSTNARSEGIARSQTGTDLEAACLHRQRQKQRLRREPPVRCRMTKTRRAARANTARSRREWSRSRWLGRDQKKIYRCRPQPMRI